MASTLSLSMAMAVIYALMTFVTASKIPLACTVIMYNPWDYRLDGEKSKCIATIENARKTCGGNRINFMATLYFVTNDVADPVNTLKRYCVEGGESCAEANARTIGVFREGMTACFKRAVALGFSTLEVTPHLDDAAGKVWRNAIPFNPSRKYGRNAYVDVMIRPLADAFHAVLSPKVKVFFALQGEMGATVTKNAAAYIPLVAYTKTLVTRTAKARYRSNVKVGISTNWNKLCGCGSASLGIDPDAYIVNFEKQFKQVVRNNGLNLPKIRQLYNTVDFVGISYYPYKAQALTPRAFEYGYNLFARELKLYGIDLRALIKKGKSFRLHEFGVGGGLTGDGKTPAPLKSLLLYPFFGIGGSYSRNMDPFKLWRPANQRVPEREVLRAFYVGAIRWFAKQGGPRFHFDAVYLWNSGSWDVTGTNPSTPTGEGTWRDPLTQQRIKRYNDKGVVP